MLAERFWSEDRFPVVYEDNHPKAVMVDMETFEKIGMILDNLMNREAEAEDRLLSSSSAAKHIPPSFAPPISHPNG